MDSLAVDPSHSASGASCDSSRVSDSSGLSVSVDSNKPRSRRTHRRYYNEKRYHSEVRQEAVQQALAALQDKPKQVVPLPSKRASVARPVSRHLQGEDHE